MAENKVVIDDVALAEFIRAPDGPIGRYLMVIGEEVKVATIAKLKPGFPADYLGPKIVKRMTEVDGAPRVQVGADDIKTHPHVIQGNPTLAFRWPKVGPGMFFFHRVNHPGSDFHDYLTKLLTETLTTINLAHLAG